MIVKVPQVKIASIHCFSPVEPQQFSVKILVNQDEETLKSFPFLPFIAGEGIKSTHPVYLKPEERKHIFSFTWSFDSLAEAKEKEILYFNQVQDLLKIWLGQIKDIMDWESSHSEYDSSKTNSED